MNILNLKFPSIRISNLEQLGEQIGQLCDQESAFLRTIDPEVPERCADCPFRTGAPSNLDTEKLMETINDLNQGEIPKCHMLDGEDGKPTRPCAGGAIFWLARLRREMIEVLAAMPPEPDE